MVSPARKGRRAACRCRLPIAIGDSVVRAINRVGHGVGRSISPRAASQSVNTAPCFVSYPRRETNTPRAQLCANATSLARAPQLSEPGQHHFTLRRSGTHGQSTHANAYVGSRDDDGIKRLRPSPPETHALIPVNEIGRTATRPSCHVSTQSRSIGRPS